MKEKYWDDLATDFSSQVLEISERDLDGVIRRTARKLGSQRKRATDFGCGPGSLTRVLAPYFKTVTGVDFSHALLAKARDATRASNVTYEWADLSASRGKRFTCDVAFCANVLLIDQAQVRERIARRVIASIKKGGYGVFIVPAMEAILRSYQMALQWQLKDGHSRPDALKDINAWVKKEIVSLPEGIVRVGGAPTKHFLADELCEFLSARGLEDISLARVSYPWSEVFEDTPRSVKAAPPWDWMAVGRKR